MTDAAKASVWSIEFTPQLFAPPAQVGAFHSATGAQTLNTRLLFAGLPPAGRSVVPARGRLPGGQPKAQEKSGLHYNWHRHYDPTLGRYTQPDPLGLVDGPSVYAYARNAPLLVFDFDGRETYYCRRPLKNIPFQVGTLSHSYVCSGDPADLICGGLGPEPSDRSFMKNNGVPGSIEPDQFDPKRCTKKVDENKCVEQCIQTRLKEPPPEYGFIWGFGTSCHEFADEIITECKRSCPNGASGG